MTANTPRSLVIRVVHDAPTPCFQCVHCALHLRNLLTMTAMISSTKTEMMAIVMMRFVAILPRTG